MIGYGDAKRNSGGASGSDAGLEDKSKDKGGSG